MPYQYSQIDTRNLGWFPNDVTRASLLAIRIRIGEIRGLQNILLEFKYPITAIAGKNGSGKTTVLALAACAFHNRRNGYRLASRKLPYYTFKDFFIQTRDEVSLEGIYINYQILNNTWRLSANLPNGEGAGWQLRKKSSGGRWNNYDRRVGRTVVYLGIDRVVPHVEKSVSVSYRSRFERMDDAGWEDDVRSIVGRILDRDYSQFNFRQHTRYRLPVVRYRNRTVSGFNMGAGEDALFELISTILDCPHGSLILIDEIELGLHEEAQKKLIQELKQLCLDRHIQIICTTHSAKILDSLPPEGRIYLERVGTQTHVLPGISSDFASGKLAGLPSRELDILVEDEVAKVIIENCLDNDLRQRITIYPIGSDAAVMRHLAYRHIEQRDGEVCSILDGDKSGELDVQLNNFESAIENDRLRAGARDWAENRISFLPGATWPEAWVVNTRENAMYQRLEHEFHLDEDEANELLSGTARAGKHNEFFDASQRLQLDEQTVRYQLVKGALESYPDEVTCLNEFISRFLD